MKILFDLQLSNYDKLAQRMLASDSNWNFTRNMMRGLMDIGIDCAIIAPDDEPMNSFPEWMKVVGVYKHYFPRIDRFLFDMRAVDAIQDYEPDIIWTNDPCRVGAYREIFDGKIISYNHWIDDLGLDPKNEQKNSLFFRQIEGLYKSDLSLANSKIGEDQLREMSKRVVLRNAKLPSISHVNPAIDSALIKRVRDRDNHYEKLTILFNHRLSTAPQYSYGVEQLQLLIHHMGDYDYEILVTNPSAKDHKVLENSKVRVVYQQDYEKYIEAISGCFAQVNFFNWPGQWSMAMQESLALGHMVFHNGRYGYGELAGGWGYMHTDSMLGTHKQVIPKIASDVKNTWESRVHSQKYFDAQSRHFLLAYEPKNVVVNQLLPLLERLMIK